MKTEIYNNAASSAVCHETLRNEGALLVRGFVPCDEQEKITADVLACELTEVDRSGHTIPEQFQDIEWEFEQAPASIIMLGKRVCELVRPEIPTWFVNQARAQLYTPGEVGIEWHRDYKRDLRVVAVISFISKARFDIRLDSGEVTWDLYPGDLMLMRGALLNGRKDDRPLHRVEPPVIGQRLSLAYRQVSASVPELEG